MDWMAARFGRAGAAIIFSIEGRIVAEGKMPRPNNGKVADNGVFILNDWGAIETDQASDARPFEVIVVHSFSRFFRDAFGFEIYVRRLAKHWGAAGVDHPGIGRHPSQVMMRQMIALFR